MITHKQLRELLYYHPKSGDFVWLKGVSPRAGAGTQAGCLQSWTGYWLIRVDRKLYRAHRLAWFYIHGAWPEDQIDHKNRIRSDNRIDNLRLASSQENTRNSKMRSNNTTGHTGVSRKGNKWHATITIDGKKKWLGCFGTPEAASAAYKSASVKYFGEFSPVG